MYIKFYLLGAFIRELLTARCGTACYEKEIEPIGVQRVTTVEADLNRDNNFSKVLPPKGETGRVRRY